MKCSQCAVDLAPDEEFCGFCGKPAPKHPPRFQQAEQRFQGLRRRYQEGNLSETDYDLQLQELVIEDKDGAHWMIGADTGRWYWFNGDTWIPREPPQAQATNAPTEVSSPTPGIRHRSKRRRLLWLAPLILLPLVCIVALVLSAVLTPYPKLAYYSALIVINSDNPDSYFERAQIYRFELDDLEAAEADLTALIALQPTAFHYEMRGDINIEQGEYSMAVADYSKGLELDPEQGYLYISRGKAYEQLGEFEKALNDYDSAVTQEPERCFPLYTRGVLLQKQGQIELARQDFLQALTYNSDDCYFLYDSELALEALGDAPPAPVATIASPTPTTSAPTPEIETPSGMEGPAWEMISLSSEGIMVPVPTDWEIDLMEDSSILFANDAEELCLMTLSWYGADAGASAQGELEYWLNIHSDTTWQPLSSGDTQVGSLAQTRGEKLGSRPIHATMVGPTRDNLMLYWWGQPLAESWDSCINLFELMIMGTFYAD